MSDHVGFVLWGMLSLSASQTVANSHSTRLLSGVGTIRLLVVGVQSELSLIPWIKENAFIHDDKIVSNFWIHLHY
jgi:hypothetical protein